MKKTIKVLALPFLAAVTLFSVSALSAPADKTAPPQTEQGFHLPPFPGGHMAKPGFCHGGELFCATSASDNPTETINKLTSVIPASAAKHYEVRVSVVALPDKPPAPSVP
ncbi:hypothetical protein AB6825_20975 [Serratia proteamaculans]|uniref:hypothetical protein n=1 Tax=Serratia proteamaculans TaxID=28151 RepID=UPI002177FB62|nr:hypothetical protein [Serratia proteamaculans]CAI0704222.1 Uncharacterised protein [Serratia proteamaculans]CAI1509148.1 Uncharacterised protein [Serratia proteamaculans]CAI1509164.1 Uncharacterised protein [Serratia proteamaculans]CAI1878160.1 Uncharacterised protein [Serratia proteamaculans]CAI2480009.1 Uncharacterised protein [Serratia proteamaculans]